MPHKDKDKRLSYVREWRSKNRLRLRRYLKRWRRKRDGKIGVCRFCEKKKRKLEVHHIDRNTKNNKPDNLIALCTSCHHKLHSKIYSKLKRSKKLLENKNKEVK